MAIRYFTKTALLFAFLSPACATVITFTTPEQISLNTTQPYTESGFTFTPTRDSASAIFPASFDPYGFGFTGSWLSFASNTTMVMSSPKPFTFTGFTGGWSIMTYAGADTLTMTAMLADGATVVRTYDYAYLTQAAYRAVNLANVKSVVFSADNAVGIDDVIVSVSNPEPGTWFMLAGVLALVGARKMIESYGELRATEKFFEAVASDIGKPPAEIVRIVRGE